MRYWRSLRENLTFLKGNVLVLTVTRVLGTFTRNMVFPYASLFVLALGGEPRDVGVVNFWRPVAGLLVFPIAGYLTDRTGRVRLIAWGGYFSAAVLLLYVVAPTWEVLAVAALLRGFMIVQFPPSSALLADSLAPEDRAKGVATMNSLSGILALLSPYIAGAVLVAYGDERGMRILYGIMTAIYFVNAIINHRFLQETTAPSDERVRLSDFPQVIARTYRGIPAMIRGWSPSLRATAAILLLGFTANAVSGAFWVVYATEQIGLSTQQWGLILLIETLLRNVAYVPAGVLADRLGRSRFVALSLALSTVSLPAFVLATGFWGALAVRGVIGVSNALFTPACCALVADTVPRESRGRVTAAIGRGSVLLGSTGGGTGGPGMGFLMTLPVMFGALGGGYLYDLRPALPWLVALLALLVASLLAWRSLSDPREAHV